MPQRTCTTTGCSKPHRAKGLCSTCYNQQKYTPEQRHVAHTVPCGACGTPIQRPAHADRQHACSVRCRTILQHGHAPGTSVYDWATDAARRAYDAGATVVDLFDRDAVFERDTWTCGICREPVAKDASPFDPLSATVDHIVPLSRGGEHTLANAQCAHLRCNSIKRDALAGHAG